MKAKTIAFLVMTLLISTAALSVAVNVEKNCYNILGWSEKQKLLASDGTLNDRFGCSVEINANDAIIGAYFDDVGASTNAGSAYVFTYGGASWTQQAKLTASDYDTDDEFGTSVSIDGDTAIVGAPKEDASGASAGAAYVFVRTGSSWSQQQKLIASDGEAGDQFGRSVSVDGDYAIVGAPEKNSGQGFSYIFKRTGGAWTQMTKVGATGSNKLGWSVSIDGAFVIMGAYGTNSNTGTAHIYELVGSSWYGKGALTASDGAISDLFGTSVAIDGNYAICGAPGHDLTSGGEGAAYIFEKPTTGWTTMTETQKITASDAAVSDGFGRSVAVEGDYAIVTAPDNDDSGTASGSAYIFKRGSSTWSEVVKLLASDGASQDYFGWSASVSSPYAIVGAYADDNTNGVDAGSSYLFEFVNQAPSTPSINGPINGIKGTSYPYTFTSTDADGDQVSYYVDWGDSSNTGWFGPFASGATQTKSHIWASKGTYTIQAKARDTNGAESGWGSLTVTMPRNRAINPFLRLVGNYPILNQILKLIS